MEGKYNRGLTFHFLIYNSNNVRGSMKDILQ